MSGPVSTYTAQVCGSEAHIGVVMEAEMFTPLLTAWPISRLHPDPQTSFRNVHQ